jgi:hypothetical protein
MKKLLALTLLIPSLVLAETTQKVDIPVTTNNTTDARNMSTSTNTGSDLSHAVGMAVAPALTTTFSETCMGSTSAGAGFAGGAVSIGSTWEDEACIRRLDAREVKSMGDAETAKEIMCGSKEVREAFKRVGRPCAIDGGTYAATPKPININDLSKQKQQELYQAAVVRQSSSPKF